MCVPGVVFGIWHFNNNISSDQALDRIKELALYFVIFAEAFDLIDSRILIRGDNAMMLLRISHLAQIHDCLTRRAHKFVVQGKESGLAEMDCDVRQDLVFRPCLLNLFVNDLFLIVLNQFYSYIDDAMLQYGSNSLAMVQKDSHNLWSKL